MKRFLAVALSVALVAVLLVPAMAFAGKGNDKVPPGQAKKAGVFASTADVAEDGGVAEDGEVPGKKNGKSDKPKGKPEWAGSDEASGTPDPSQEESGTTAPDGAGIENALSRIQANIAKSEAKVAAGTKKQVPPGLLKVLAKFMGWLGTGMEDPGDDPFDGEGSQDETMTPDPSENETVTPDPSQDDSPTPDPPVE